MPPSDEALRAAAEEDKVAATTDSDTEPDHGAAPRGAGLRGQGPPYTVGSGAKRRPFYDGGGLCSPGRWPPHRRPVPSSPKLAQLRSAIWTRLRGLLHVLRKSAQQIMSELLKGGQTESPFRQLVLQELVDDAHRILGDDAVPLPHDRPCVVRLRLLRAILREAADPDAEAMLGFIEGVPIGVGLRLPRTPAVYDRRVRWSLDEQRHRGAYLEPQKSFEWRDNYKSTYAHESEIEQQLEKLASEGKALKFQEDALRRRWPDAVPASLGALEKIGAAGDLTVRLLFDGSHGVDVNKRIRQRDQDRSPSAPDIKRLLRAVADTGRRARTMTADVEDAHRLVNIRPADWKHQLCRARAGGPLFAFTVGVFGVCSISYWWSRLAGGALRGLHYLSTEQEALWVLLVADDFKVESTAVDPDAALLYALLVLVLFGLPLKWKKTSGGDEVEWVGYHVLLLEHSLGLSARRAEWAVNWCTTLAQAGATLVSDFRDGLGRLSFAVGALEHERPFLAPLFAYASRHPTNAVRTLPTFVRLLLTFLAERIRRRRHYCCAVRRSSIRHAPRVDARAEGREIGIGGWLPLPGADGRIDKAASPWFACTLTQASAPWAFCKGGQPFRTIAALEGLAVLFAVQCFRPWLGRRGRGSVQVPAWTDNQGNSFVLNRLMTSRFPLVCIVMELASILDREDLRLEVSWTPRDMNTEADALSNGVYEGFEDAHRIRADPASMQWEVLDQVMEQGLVFYNQLPAASGGPPPRKRARGERLRFRDPW